MKNRKTKFWVFYITGSLLLSIISGMNMKYQQTGNAFHPSVIVPIFVIFLMAVSEGYLIIYTINKASKFNQSQINKWIIPSLLIFYVITFLIADLSVTIGVLGWYLINNWSFAGFWTQLFHHELNYANASLYKWLIFFTIAFFYMLWYKSAKKEQKLIAENLKFRYNTLKSQVNPHFLFNSLNTLSELIYVDVNKADNYIQTLSGIYRYVLENEETELVDLEKEIEFVKQYFLLHEVRDEGKIALEINIDKTEGIKIIPVSLQLLLENALKHNAISKEKPLKISISLKGDNIIISNNIQKKNILNDSTQIGLSNLKDRTKILLGREPEISNENNIFTVKLPIQNK
jgi:two-component system, LytTR family, sensor kinase